VLTPVSRTSHVRAGGAALFAAADPKPQRSKPRKLHGIPADEALALAQLRRYTCERRQAISGRTTTNIDPRNQPGKNSSRANRYDARIIRCIDFANALNTLDALDSTILQLVYSDGETLETTAKATGWSTRHIVDRLPAARRALMLALEERNLL
jgi:DNA-directed RNA polymerase specialized sigma24 family protein